MRRHPDAARRVGFAVVGALAGLHQVDYAGCDLADLGRPDGFVARQVRGWRNRWEAVAHGAAATAQPLMREVADTLERTLPAPQRSAILHNDLKLDNCQFDPADPDRVHSVFDWDMATLGDPLVDVGILLNYWPDPADTPDDRGMYPDGQESARPARPPGDPRRLRRRDRPRPRAVSAGTRPSPAGRRRSCCSSCTTATCAGKRPTSGWPPAGTGSRNSPPVPAACWRNREKRIHELGLRNRSGIPGAARLDGRLRAPPGRAGRPPHQSRVRHDRPGAAAADPPAAAQRSASADCGPATSARTSAAPVTVS